MYHGKHLKETKRKPWLLVLLAAVLVLSTATVGVWAYLKLATPPVTNNFTPAFPVTPEINETFVNNVKSNVTIRVGDTGYSVYVRAAIIVTWQDAEGNVYFTQPEKGTDYSITYGSDWTQGSDGYWYYTDAVASGGETNPLIVECYPLQEAPVEGYTLNVKIIAQTIQTAGMTDDNSENPAQNAWGLS